MDDTVLVTTDGAEVLTAVAPLQPDEVEATIRETRLFEFVRSRGSRP